MNFKCDDNDDCGDNSDETDCPPPSSEDTTLLVFGSQDGLYEIDVRNKSRMTRISKKIVLSFDFPSEPSQIYWSDGKRIYQLSRHNGNNEAVKFRPDDVKSVASLAVDGPANKLYWTDTLQGAIYVGDLKNDRTIKLMEENLESPRAIVLSKGYMYFAEGGRKPKIERARLDGSKRKTLFISDSNLVPNGLALDETRNKLYCAGTDLAGYGVIGVITLSDLRTTFIFQRTGYRPFGLDIFEEHVYWTDLRKKALLRINKSSGTGMEVILSGLNKPKGLKILQIGKERLDYDNSFSTRVTTMSTVVPGATCAYRNGGCEHLCLNLLHPTEQKCLCEEGFRLGEDGKTCEMVSVGNITNLLKEQLEEKKGEPWIAVIWLLSTLSLLLVLFLGGAAVKKLLSYSRQRGLPDVLRMSLRKESNDTEMKPMNGPVAGDTNIMHADPLVDNTTDASPEWNQQVCSAESTGACAVSEDLPLQVQVQGDVVVYNTVNMMNTVHMNTTNNVELQQSGGVTVVGDEAKVNYHQPPTS
ncbi:unnamed protein product [Porites evermanni]|uniref:Vitellogenin receptor n=1 Tax=Porites evermanni TaxID=104178 RepID=A0ABN8RPH4_9CNID|nr:unnamed protein product [Porites evermanni]